MERNDLVETGGLRSCKTEVTDHVEDAGFYPEGNGKEREGEMFSLMSQLNSTNCLRE
jgi:hypothetical protein